jgi:colanic acid/amylovoran biosynthesis protein
MDKEMKIQIDGTNTVNKGAELMFYAVLEQVKKRCPQALIYYNQSGNMVEKSVKQRWILKSSIIGKYIRGVLRRLDLHYAFLTPKYASKGIDLVLDAGGFQFYDRRDFSNRLINLTESYYAKLKKNGTKIFFLPQAFGPFETKSGKRFVNILNNYVDVIIAREVVSYTYLLEAGIDKDKIWIYPDFTLLVEGTFPTLYDNLKGNVCIIPNIKMITNTRYNEIEYIDFFKTIINIFEKNNLKVFLLNHENKGDFNLCKKINRQYNNRLPIVTGLNAKEIKGVIGEAFMVVSSRYHGVANALSQGVPCIATSWSHKYEMLLNDFVQFNKVIDINSSADIIETIIQDTINNHSLISNVLKNKKEEITIRIVEMWNKLFDIF